MAGLTQAAGANPRFTADRGTNLTGLSGFYRGDAVLLQDESQSRGSDDEERRKRERRRAKTRAFRQMWGSCWMRTPSRHPPSI